MKKILRVIFFLQFWMTFLFISLLDFLSQVFSAKQIIRAFNKNKKSILILEAWFPENAGYHYRSKIWADIFHDHGFRVRIKSVLSRRQNDQWLANKDGRFHIKWLWKRTWQLLTAWNYKTVIVRRDLLLYNDYGNLFMEKFLRSFHPDVILDFDDDIAAAKREPREIKSIYGKLMMEQGNKFRKALHLYDRFVVGNSYLKEYLKKYKPGVKEENILVVPTCVNYDQYPAKIYPPGKDEIILGWIGVPRNMRYFDILIPHLNKIAKRKKIKLLVISSKDFDHPSEFEVINHRWSLKNEIHDLMQIDIGLMPLWQTETTKGKSGFKLIQYMGLGIIGIASGISTNNEIVDDNINGFLVEKEEDWEMIIEKAINRWNEFNQIGAAAREKIKQQYSFSAYKNDYLKFLNRPS